MKIVKFISVLLISILCISCEKTVNEGDLANGGVDNTGQTPGGDDGTNPGGEGSGEVTPPVDDIIYNTTNIIPPLVNPSYSKLTASNHPRVIFTEADFAGIKNSTSPVTKQIHTAIVSTADGLLNDADLTYSIPDGKRLLETSREAAKRLLYCAYAYKTTGDAKYLTKAKKDLNTVCGWNSWNASRHFLDAGVMAAGVGLAYDWLYSNLSGTERTKVVKALVTNAINPAYASKIHDFPNMQNNWNQVCYGGLVCAALAIYENKGSYGNISKIITDALSKNKAAVQAIYNPDGNYPEGYSYWNFGTIFQALLNTSLDTAAGGDAGICRIDGFTKTGKYMLFMEGIGSAFNYSDSNPDASPCLAQWYFAYRYQNPSYLYIEKNRVNRYSAASEGYLLPLVAYYAHKLNLSSLSAIPAPSEKLYRGNGATPVVLAHSTWSRDADDKYLGVKAGKGTTAHSHLDAGTFVYEAYGERWSHDLGMPSYSSLESKIDLWNMNAGSERWTAFHYNNFNHSTITVNNALHKAGGAATVKEVYDTDAKRGAKIDLTNAVGNVASAIRTIYIEGDDLVIIDEIKANSSTAAEVRWSMLTKADVTTQSSYLKLAGSKKTMYMKKSGSTAKWFIDDVDTFTLNSSGAKPKTYRSFDVMNKVKGAGYIQCGYTMTVAKGTTSTVTIRLTPNRNG